MESTYHVYLHPIRSSSFLILVKKPGLIYLSISITPISCPPRCRTGN